MEGNYSKVVAAKKEVPPKYYSFFLERLTDTLRQKVAVSIEKSYKFINTEAAQKMLMLNSAEELKAFADALNASKTGDTMDDSDKVMDGVRWEIKDGKLYFTQVN